MPTEPEPRSPFVGRAEDLDSLSREIGLVGAPESGPSGASVLLAGDAGLGKTRLLAELRKDAVAAGWRVFVGHCLDFGDSTLPYLPFTELFGAIARDEPGAADRLVAEQPALARLMPGRRMRQPAARSFEHPSFEDPSLENLSLENLGRAELFDAVYAGLALLAADAPLLVILEDIHWADQSTRDLLTGLFTRPPAGPIAIVASYRTDDLHRRHPLRAATAEWARLARVTRMTVQPLPDKDVRRLVRALHPAPISDMEVRRIVSRAEGNAFFTEELVAAAGDGGRMLPADLADLLLVRLDRLDEETREIVRAAAAAGRRVSHDLLAAVLERRHLGDGFDAGLRAAVEANVLLPIRDRYAFRHALLAEAVYDDLLPGERVRWHTAYVEALTAPGARATAAELARHARAAGNGPIALRASIDAGDEAMSVGGPDDALLHYEAALELLAMDGTEVSAVDRVGLAIKASDAALAAGRVHRAFRLVRRELLALPESAGPVQRARLLQATANAALLTDTGIDVLELTTEALALLGADEVTPLRARLANSHALASLDRYREDEAVRWLDIATDLGTTLGLPGVVADAAVTRSYIERRQGDPDGSREALATTIAAAHNAGEVAAEIRSTFGLANLHFDLGELTDARATYEQAHRLARDSGRRWAPYGVDARIMAGIVAYTTGQWGDALQISDTSNEEAPPLAKAALTTITMAVAAGRGDAAALDQVAAVRQQWRHDALVALLSAMALIDLYGDTGDLPTAEAVHDEVVDVVSEMWDRSTFQARIRMSALLIGQLTRAAGAGGDRERLVDRGEELAAAGRKVASEGRHRGRHGIEGQAWLARMDAELARLHWVAAVDVPDERDLRDRWEAAVAGFERFGNVFEQARSRTRLAAVLRAAGDAAAASRELQLARTSAMALGSVPLLGEIRSLGPAGARSAGGSTVGSTAREGPTETLTPRETEVLALVAEGRTNGEIGRQLFISTKTVSVHVSNILAKLGATGRTEAAAVARRRGLLNSSRLEP